MDEIDQLRNIDPVRTKDLEMVSSHPVFDELFEDIVTGARALDPGSTLRNGGIADRMAVASPSGAARHRHRRVRVAAVVGVAALLVGAVLAVQSSSGPTSKTGSRTVTGLKWQLVSDISPSWRLLPTGYAPGMTLVCPTATTCYADDLQQGPFGGYSAIEVTTDGGTTWQPSTLPVPLTGATPLVCIDADTCATLGLDSSGDSTYEETTDGGSTWSAEAGPSRLTSSIGVSRLACTSADSCVAVASDPADQSGAAFAFATNDEGASWTSSAMPMDFVPEGVRCLSAESCVAVGFDQSPRGSSSVPPGAILYSTDDGASWSSATTPPNLGPIGSLSCADTTDCVASTLRVGDPSPTKMPLSSEVLNSTDGGQTWSDAGASGLSDAFVMGLSCPAPSACWASGVVRHSTAGSGAIGSPRVIIAHGVAAALKLGSNVRGFVASTSDNGQTWRIASLPQRVGGVIDIACPTTTSCFALAISGAVGFGHLQVVLLASTVTSTAPSDGVS